MPFCCRSTGNRSHVHHYHQIFGDSTVELIGILLVFCVFAGLLFGVASWSGNKS